jgi:putative ABC transport system permease protein
MKYAYFIWKNLTRKKARTTLTFLSIFVAFILFGLLGAVNQAFNAGADIAGANRLITIHKISLVQSLPESYVARIEQLEGVGIAAHASWFGGYYQDPKNAFAQFATNGERYLEIYSELVLPEEQKTRWLANRTGAIVGESLVRRFGWKVGDRVPIISSIYPHNGGQRTWEFEIDGIFTSTEARADTSYMLFHYEYFDEARDFGNGTIGWVIFTIDNPENAVQIAKSVDDMFANSPAETKTSTEKAFAESFAKQFGDIGLITRLVLSAVFFTMLLVTGNTMAQTVRERISELAVLKTMGFSDASMLVWVLGESVTLAMAGGIAALILDYGIIGALAANVGAYLPGLALTSPIIFQGLGLALLFGVLAGLFPALQAMRLNVATALARA